MTSLEKAKKVVEILSKRKAFDVVLIEVGNLTSITDYFVICSGNSETQIKSLADEVDEKMKEQDISPSHVEGYRSASWILLDYDDVIVHVFHKESRMFYSLEHLWGDAKRIDISDIITEE